MRASSIEKLARYAAYLFGGVAIAGGLLDAVSNVLSLPAVLRWCAIIATALCWAAAEYYTRHGVPWRKKHGVNSIGFVLGARHRLALAGIVALFGIALLAECKNRPRVESPDVQDG